MFFDNDEDDRDQQQGARPMEQQQPRWGNAPDPNAQPVQQWGGGGMRHQHPDWGGIMQRLRQRFAGRFGQNPQAQGAPVQAPMGAPPAAPTAGLQDAARLFGRRQQPGGILGTGGQY